MAKDYWYEIHIGFNVLHDIDRYNFFLVEPN